MLPLTCQAPPPAQLCPEGRGWHLPGQLSRQVLAGSEAWPSRLSSSLKSLGCMCHTSVGLSFHL